MCLPLVLLLSMTLAQAPAADHASPKGSGHKQRNITTEKHKVPERPWLERAKGMTTDIEQDSNLLITRDAALVNARLASLWWQVDRGRALAWLRAAADSVTRVPSNESQADKNDRVTAALDVLKIAAPLDQETAATISARLKQEDTSDQRVASVLGRAATEEIFAGNVTIAGELTSSALKAGSAPNAVNVILNIRPKQPNLADKLFREALDSLRKNNYDPRSLAILADDAFPRSQVQPRRTPPQDLVNAYLSVLAEAVLRTPQNDLDQRSICANQEVVGRLLKNYADERAVAIRGALAVCTADRSQNSNSSDLCGGTGGAECRRAADLQADLEQRVRTKEFAVTTAYQTERNPELALSILKSFSKEERAQSDTYWDELQHVTLALGSTYLRSADYQALYNLLRDTDDRILLQVQLAFARRILADGNLAEGISVLGKARDTLVDKGSSRAEDYVSLLNQYARYSPESIVHVLGDLVQTLNRLDKVLVANDPTPIPAASPQRSPVGALTDHMQPPALSDSLLDDLDPNFINATLKDIQSPGLRQCWRLGFVAAMLRRDAKESKPSPPSRRIRTSSGQPH